jgi:hypothetical protein
MSKKYQYFASKRGSCLYFEAKTLCKNKRPHNHVICEYCLRPAGRTRRIQQDKLKILNVISN